MVYGVELGSDRFQVEREHIRACLRKILLAMGFAADDPGEAVTMDLCNEGDERVRRSLRFYWLASYVAPKGNGDKHRCPGMLTDQSFFACAGSHLDPLLRVCHHQVAVHEPSHALRQRLQYRRPNGDVGHVVAVHHIHMQPVCTLPQDAVAVLYSRCGGPAQQSTQ